MTMYAAIKAIGLVSGVVLLGYGCWFLIEPDAALRGTYHSAESLTLVMGGRYFFFGTLLIAALLYGDVRVTAFLLAGFAALAVFDTVLYLSASPLPHFAVGVVAAAASFYFFRHRKVAS